MARILVSDLVTEIETELSQVTGAVTQQYGEPRIIQHIQDAYLFLIEEFEWRELQKYHQKTLDGTTGVITTDLTTALTNHEISSFDQILAVWLEDSNRQLPILPPRINPYTLSGTSGQYIDSDDTDAQRPFKVYPITSDDDVVVLTKAHPSLPLTDASYVYTDRLLITYYAAYLYAEDDATAPGQINKFREKYEQRVMQVRSRQNNQPLLLDPRNNSDNTGWTER